MTPADVKGGTTQSRRAIDSYLDDMTRYRRRLSDRTRSTFDESSGLCAEQGSLFLDQVEVSVVMPCLNEEESVGICVKKALAGLAACGVVGEVIVCDNGSSDNSVEVARSAGARVVNETARGYGNAYLRGFDTATGRIIVMGDSDDSYDFTQLRALVNKINEGYDYVLGSRFGGEIRRGAMSWSHRYIGNPILTTVLNRFFGLKSSDAHSGMRAFTREALDRMALRCEGMEFASEMVVKAAACEPSRRRGPHRLSPSNRRIEAEPSERWLAASSISALTLACLFVSSARNGDANVRHHWAGCPTGHGKRRCEH